MKVHIWEKSGLAFCGVELPYEAGHHSSYVGAYPPELIEGATCLWCLRLVRDQGLWEAERGSKLAKTGTETIERLQRAARRRKKARTSKETVKNAD